ncbi:MAG: DUF2800 domain-containing protein [Selenomonadaceae bacterium]|nr:DUF2800 domain-containing protein [Selenomonadaceae bacterium]
MAEHAVVSPSAAHRWMECTPSARLEQQFPDTRSESAAEGTFAHAWAEMELKEFIKDSRTYKDDKAQLMKNDFWSPALEEYVEEYINEVIHRYLNARDRDSAAVLLLEQKLDLREWVPDGFGRGDAVIVSDGTMEILDLKYGRNVPVTAVGNPQLRLYALGAYRELSCVYDIDRVRMTIVQPRNGGISSEELTSDGLLIWGESVKPLAEKAFKGEGDFVPGEHCRFCRAQNRCRALAEYEMEIAKKQFDDMSLLTDDEISDILEKAEGLVSWVNGITAYALREAVENGRKWPGWKLVEGRSNRKLKDENEARKILEKAGYTEEQIMKPREIKGFTDLEKLTGKKKLDALLKDVILKPPGKPKLAPESDKRPEWNSAKADFDDLDKEAIPF